MADYEFKMPDIGEGIAEGEIVSWKVEVGQKVDEEEDFVEVMTDKATVTITVPHAGVIKDLCAKEGEVVPVHEVIAVIDTSAAQSGNGAASAGGSAVSAPSPAKAATPETVPAQAHEAASPGRVLASPATRRRAREAGVDLAALRGTGPSGRVTNEDLESHLSASPENEPSGTPTALPVDASGRSAAFDALIGNGPASPGERVEERIPFRGLRRRIAEAMSRSKSTATHFSVVEDVDVTDLVGFRDEVKDLHADLGIRITYMPFVLKALVAGLRAYPWLNATLDEATQEVVLKRYYNIGIATDTPNGLIVPVIRDVDRKSIVELARELGDLAKRTREGKVSSDELKDGTFTITSAGNLGGLFATPIINFPEVAILGVHKIQKTPRVMDGAIVARDVMYLSVSIDHRIVDGADGVRFVNLMKDRLSDPRRLLLYL